MTSDEGTTPSKIGRYRPPDARLASRERDTDGNSDSHTRHRLACEGRIPGPLRGLVSAVSARRWKAPTL